VDVNGRRWWLLVAVALVVAGCGRGPQTVATGREGGSAGDTLGRPLLVGDVPVVLVWSGRTVRLDRIDGVDHRPLASVELDQDVGWLSANVRGDSVDLLVGTCDALHDPDDLGMHDLCDAGGKVQYLTIGPGWTAARPVTIATGDEVAVLLGAAGDDPVVITNANAYVSSDGRHWERWTENPQLLDHQRFTCPTRIGLVGVPIDLDATTTTFAPDAQAQSLHVLVVERGGDEVRSITLPEGAKGAVDMVTCGSDSVVVHTTYAAVSSLWFLDGPLDDPHFTSATLSGPAGSSQQVLSEDELVFTIDPNEGARRSVLFDRTGELVASWDGARGRGVDDQSDMSAFYGQTPQGIVRIDSRPRANTWVSRVDG
jgi:hypothetical protein